MFDYEVKIADSPQEIEKALRLRFEVFKLEMVKGAAGDFDTNLDTDEYDRLCKHLVVIDRSTNEVVGTYRLLVGQDARGRISFYSEKFFDIANIKRLDGQVLELGRSCVRAGYRDQMVINLLWSGIAAYIKERNVKYLFGSVRLTTVDPHEVSAAFDLIKKRYYAQPEFRVMPWPQNAFKGLDEGVEVKGSAAVMRGLPPLIKGYLMLGVKVCGPPAVNPDFGSIVFFILLGIEKMSPSYKKAFLRDIDRTRQLKQLTCYVPDKSSHAVPYHMVVYPLGHNPEPGCELPGTGKTAEGLEFPDYGLLPGFEADIQHKVIP